MITQLDRSIYLASRSARRRELLSQIGVRFHMLMFRDKPETDPDLDETVLAGETPALYVERVARAKAHAGWRRLEQRSLPRAAVLAADTTVALDGRIMGKPADRRDAAVMLAAGAPIEAPPLTAVRPPFVPPDIGPVSPDLAQLRAAWDQVRDAVNTQDKKAGALLNKVSYARSVEGDRVEIGFVSRPLMEIAQGPGVLQRIGEAVGHGLGRPVQVVPVLWEELRDAGGGPPSQPRSSHLVDEALKQGAELIAD